MVGAWGASSAAGEVLVVFGAASLPAVVTASDVDGAAGFIIRGATTSDASGFSVAAGGVSWLLRHVVTSVNDAPCDTAGSYLRTRPLHHRMYTPACYSIIECTYCAPAGVRVFSLTCTSASL